MYINIFKFGLEKRAMGKSNREILLEYLINLKSAGVNLDFERILRDEKRRYFIPGKINIGIHIPGRVIIAPEQPRKGIHLFCRYFENLVDPLYKGPRLVGMEAMGLKITHITLSNNVEYLVCRRYPPQVPYLNEDQREALKEGEVFNLAKLEI